MKTSLSRPGLDSTDPHQAGNLEQRGAQPHPRKWPWLMGA